MTLVFFLNICEYIGDGSWGKTCNEIGYGLYDNICDKICNIICSMILGALTLKTHDTGACGKSRGAKINDAKFKGTRTLMGI